LLTLVLGALGVQGSSGFRLWLQIMHCSYLLTLSKYFRWGQNFGLQVKSETSLHRGEHRRVIKLEVWPLESAFGVNSQDGEGEGS